MDRFFASQFKNKVTFYSSESIINPKTGVTKPSYVEKFSMRCLILSRSLGLQYVALKNGTTNTKSIVIRHSHRVDGTLSVLFKGERYNIKSIETDGDMNNQFDTLIIEKVSKVG